MKQVKYTFNGGLPLSQNVLDWSQQGLKDCVKALCDMGYDGDPVIIHGCLYDSGTGDVTSGWIYEGTEPMYFPGGNVVTAATTKIKVAETTGTLVYENGASQAVYSTKQYALDNTGTDDILLIRRYGLTGTSNLGFAITEAVTDLNVRVNKAARTMHIYGQIDTLTADTLAVDGLQVKLIDDTDLEADPVFGPYYPPDTREFLGVVMPSGTGSGTFNDINGNPITSIALRINNNGLYAVLRKTTAGQYPIFVNAIIAID